MFNIFKKKRRAKPREYPNIERLAPPREEKIEEPKEVINYKKSLSEIENKVKNKKIIEVMKNVQDPELMIDIWSLELIYDVEEKDNAVDVKMTFTSPTCPYGELILSDLRGKLKKAGIEAKIDVVFTPLWQPTDELREMIGV
jgi:metal-sulfur cluster biosynthetic enzyme